MFALSFSPSFTTTNLASFLRPLMKEFAESTSLWAEDTRRSTRHAHVALSEYIPEAAHTLKRPPSGLMRFGYSFLMTAPRAAAATNPDGVTFSSCSVSFVMGEA